MPTCICYVFICYACLDLFVIQAVDPCVYYYYYYYYYYQLSELITKQSQFREQARAYVTHVFYFLMNM